MYSSLQYCRGEETCTEAPEKIPHDLLAENPSVHNTTQLNDNGREQRPRSIHLDRYDEA